MEHCQAYTSTISADQAQIVQQSQMILKVGTATSPPEGALLATIAELPAMLRYFDARLILTRLRALSEGQGGPEIAFPVDTIALVRQG